MEIAVKHGRRYQVAVAMTTVTIILLLLPSLAVSTFDRQHQQRPAAAIASCAALNNDVLYPDRRWVEDHRDGEGTAATDHPGAGDGASKSCSTLCRAVDEPETFVVLTVADGAPCSGGSVIGGLVGVCVNGRCRIGGAPVQYVDGSVTVAGTQQPPEGSTGDSGATDWHRLDDGHDVTSQADVSATTEELNNNNTINDNNSSFESSFVWRETAFASCSVTCGTGEEISSIYCYDNQTHRAVSDDLCNVTVRPSSNARTCQRPACPIWISGEWSACSVTCGSNGRATRINYCVRQTDDDDLEPVDSTLCPPDNQPDTVTSCTATAMPECPTWVAGQWSLCSVTCGEGHQMRAVICRRSSSYVECTPEAKPAEQRPCRSRFTCPGDKDIHPDALHGSMISIEEQGLGFWLSNGIGDWRGTEVAENQNGGSSRRTPPGGRSMDDDSGRALSSADNELDDVASRRNDTSGSDDGLMGLGGDLATYGEAKSTENEITVTPRFVTSAWSECSDVGVRKRRVVCMVVVKSTGRLEALPDFNCPGSKPMDTTTCEPEDSSSSSAVHFAWSIQGYGPCSRSCAGGVQRAAVGCVRKSDLGSIADEFCANLPLPSAATRSCNQQPCPPTWQTTAVGGCSKTCNGGEQLWSVQCVQLSDWTSSAVPEPLPDSACLTATIGLALPPRVTACNVGPCPLAADRTPANHQNQIEEQLVQSVLDTKDSATVEASVRILSDNSDFVQLMPMGTVRIVVGGSATVLEGTTIYVECPTTADVGDGQSVSKPNRHHKVVWTKGNAIIIERAKGHRAAAADRRGTRVDRHGVLRLRRVGRRTAGTYVCHAGPGVSSNVTVRLHTTNDSRVWMDARRKNLANEGIDLAELLDGSPLDGVMTADPAVIYSVRYLRNWLTQKSVELPVFYVPLDWSPCSVRCGLGGGLQRRRVVCALIGNSWAMDVDESLCAAATADRRRYQSKLPPLVRPISDRDCGFENCPRWTTGNWTECSAKRCLSVDVGARRRQAFCISTSGQLLDDEQCNPVDRPVQREGCPHIRCKPVWKASKWTRCTATGCAGRPGVKRRSVRCVWSSNHRLPAESLCDGTRKPATSKPCKASGGTSANAGTTSGTATASGRRRTNCFRHDETGVTSSSAMRLRQT